MNRDQSHRISKALADPRRLEILEHIAAADEVACADLVADCPITQATMSHHLKELANAGLIKVRAEGTVLLLPAPKQSLVAIPGRAGAPSSCAPRQTLNLSCLAIGMMKRGT